MNAEELAIFKQQGFVVLKGLIPPEQVDAWRAEAWDTLTIDEADVAQTWPAGAGTRNANLFKPEHLSRLVYPYNDKNQVTDPRPFALPVGEQPQVKAVLDQLLG